MQRLMRKSPIHSIRVILLMSSFLAVAACGVTPEEIQQNESGAEVSDSRQAESFNAARSDELSDEELELRSDPACGAADARFEDVIIEILDIYNESVAGNDDGSSSQIPLAGHPDAPEDGDETGIAVLACDDSLIAAYAYSRTVVVNEGLLTMLSEASYAAGLYSEDPEALGRALDDIVYYALRNSFGVVITQADIDSLSESGEFSRIAGYMFSSAVAFVIYHELGHSYMGHTLKAIDDGAPADSTHETQADIFAAASIIKTGLPMDGVDLVFSILDRISPEGSLSHPSSLKRASAVQRVTRGDTLVY